MDRVKSIQDIVKKVDSVVNKLKESKSVYKDNTGFLAEADTLSHRTFVNEISSLFPEDSIFSEEGNSDTFDEKYLSEYSWIIDPICGTTNYLYKIPLFTHSLSLLHDGEVISAAVYDPSRKEMFFSDGNSFYINNKKYCLNNSNELSQSLISLNTNQSNFDNDDESLSYLLNKIGPPVCRRVHILESANLELAYVAAGRLDAYLNPTDKPWDICAAKIFLKTAEGSFKIFKNEDENILKQTGILAAGSKKLLDQILEKL